MNNILDKICKDKLLEITEAKKKLSLDELKQNIKKKDFAFSKQNDNLKSKRLYKWWCWLFVNYN